MTVNCSSHRDCGLLSVCSPKNYKEINIKTLDGFLSLYDGCVQALPTHISVQSTCKSP